MKEAFVDKFLNVEVRDVPIPTPPPGQVLIKVVVTGTNPKDWKVPEMIAKEPTNSGDDIAGYVESVGDGVKGFAKGDRVAAFHEMTKPHGSFAEYALAWDYCTFHIPDSVSFEEAATIPLAAMTSAIGLFQILNLPPPFRPATEPTPLLIYGGSSAVGAFAIKLAKAANIHPIIAVAGKAKGFVEDLVDKSKGDVVIDYRQGDEAVVAQINEVLKGRPLLHAYDAISESKTLPLVAKVLDKKGLVTTVLPTEPIEGLKVERTMVGWVHGPQIPFAVKTVQGRQPGCAEFAVAYFKLFSWGLAYGWFSPHPHQVVEGGLDGLEKALRDLKDGKASAFKYVLRVGDTKGAGQK